MLRHTTLPFPTPPPCLLVCEHDADLSSWLNLSTGTGARDRTSYATLPSLAFAAPGGAPAPSRTNSTSSVLTCKKVATIVTEVSAWKTPVGEVMSPSSPPTGLDGETTSPAECALAEGGSCARGNQFSKRRWERVVPLYN